MATRAVPVAADLDFPRRPGGRATTLRDRALAVAPRICIERARLVTQSYRETEAEPPVVRRARALAAVLRGMTIRIDDDELLVGNQASEPRAAPLFPEYAVDWLVQELDNLPHWELNRFAVGDEVKQEFPDIAAYWRRRTHSDRVLALLPDDVKRAAFTVKAFSGAHMMASGPGHLAVDFATALTKGLAGVAAEARGHLDRIDPADPEQVGRRPFLQAVIMAMDGTIDFARRYATLARQRADETASPARREEFLEIADVCERVPAHPARTFHEALQTVLFVQLVLQIESNGHSVSLGRLDQYLWPYYAADVATGALTREHAVELVGCFWVKLFWVNKVRPWSATQFAAGYPTYQNVTVGGQTPDGTDATNEFTYVCLDAMDEVRLPTPNFSARYHDGSPDEYLLRCAELISHGFGAPAMENDEIIVPALMAHGVAAHDAYDYAMIGCTEVGVPGKWGYRVSGMSFFNLLKVLELSLNGGRDPASGVCLCPDDRDLRRSEAFADVRAAWRRQLAYYTHAHVAFDAVVDQSLVALVPDPFCSALVSDCVARGRDLNSGGARYDIVSGIQCGLANTANSLGAVKKLVFDDRLIGRDELADALAENFGGHGGEIIRQLLVNKGPKYGNDDDEVDLIARQVLCDYLEEIARYHNARRGLGPIGGTYVGSTSTASSHVPAGKVVGATPDGRFAGESVAEGASPFRGTDVLGPTAVIRSLAKLPTLEMVGGQLLNVKFSPAGLRDASGRRRILALLRAFADLKCWHIQFNIVSAETLREAQAHPERHRNLTVRVAGYCALFTALDRAMQDDIIRRTEHAFVV